MVTALSILEGKYSYIDVYTCAAHKWHLIICYIVKLKSDEDTLHMQEQHYRNNKVVNTEGKELQKEMGQNCCLKISMPTGGAPTYIV
jgi:hypothetical protein